MKISAFSPEDLRREAQISKTYHKLTRFPAKLARFPLKFPANGSETERIFEKSAKTAVSLLNSDGVPRCNSAKSQQWRLSKESAEYQESIASETGRYEFFKTLFDEKTQETVKRLPKYEKKSVIQEIIEKEYNFNRFGEDFQAKRGKSPRETRENRENSRSFRRKFEFSFQKTQENEEIRPKKDKFFFEEVKRKYFEKLKQIFEENRVEIATKVAQKQLEVLLEDYREFVDRTTEEKETLRSKLKDSTAQLLETTRTCEALRGKLRNLEQKAQSQALEREICAKKLEEMATFSAIYAKFDKRLRESFGNPASVEKFFQKYEFLETTCLELSRKKLELEDNQQILEKDKLLLRKSQAEAIENCSRERRDLEKLVISLTSSENAKKLDFQETAGYKAQYLRLFNRIMELYARWSRKNPLFSTKSRDLPAVDVQTPEEVVDLLEKFIEISTPEAAQNYLRRIIASAMRLLRRFQPEKTKEMYDPDKVYEIIAGYLDKLLAENQRFRNELAILREKRRETGKKPGKNSQNIEKNAEVPRKDRRKALKIQ